MANLRLGITKDFIKKWVDSVWDEFKNAKTVKTEKDAKAYLSLRVLFLVKEYDLANVLTVHPTGIGHCGRIVGTFKNVYVESIQQNQENTHFPDYGPSIVEFGITLKGEMDVIADASPPDYGAADEPPPF